MTNIPQSTLEKLQQLEAQFAAQRAALLGEAEKELLAKIKEARAVVADLEAQLAALKGDVAPAKARATRTRLTAEGFQTVQKKVQEILKANPHGVKMGELVAAVQVSANILRKALKSLKAKSEGEKRSTIYKL